MKTEKTHHPNLSEMKESFTAKLTIMIPNLNKMTLEEEKSMIEQIILDPKLPMSSEARKKYRNEMSKHRNKVQMEKWICDKMLAGDNLMVI